MLILSRHANESILVGDDIVITIVDIKGDRVRIGVTAPRDLRVDREEIRCEINEKAGLPPPRGPLYRHERPRPEE